MWFYKLSWVPPRSQFYYSYKVFFCFLELTDKIWGGWLMTIYKKSGKLGQGSTGLEGMILRWFELNLAYWPLSADTPLLKVTISLTVKSGGFSPTIILQILLKLPLQYFESWLFLSLASFFLSLLYWFLSFSHSHLLKCFILYQKWNVRDPQEWC